jgi:hypothetical protein
MARRRSCGAQWLRFGRVRAGVPNGAPPLLRRTVASLRPRASGLRCAGAACIENLAGVEQLVLDVGVGFLAG